MTSFLYILFHFPLIPSILCQIPPTLCHSLHAFANIGSFSFILPHILAHQNEGMGGLSGADVNGIPEILISIETDGGSPTKIHFSHGLTIFTTRALRPLQHPPSHAKNLAYTI